MDPDLLSALADRVGRGQPSALATVVRTEGSTPVKPGAKSLFDGTGRLVAGWSGGGCIDGVLGDEARAALAAGEARTASLDLSDEVLGVGLPCGGRMEVFVEPIAPGPLLEVVGHGRVAAAVLRLAGGLGFRVRHHAPGPTPGETPAERIEGDLAFLRLAESPGSYVVVASQHKGDERAIARALERGAAYVGLVASRSRGRLVLERVRELAPEAAVDLVRTPAGLDLGGETPEEIALAILAEIVQVRRRGPRP